ncbi:MAG: undecaprenyl/decaprenyl-phosphate alpha-N-acetylglucosaminyl 1-phosphate transferase [Actinobacteria bacterium]|nr:undecaprenyl/decaprenyl-phosphate alpha-N-acetylglucosaminyl 1-phosphate transferase [Actinomycetota bacterium]
MVLILAFAAALAATPLAIVLAGRLGVLDHPGELKVQSSAVPYLGGLGVAAGLAVGVVVVRPTLLLPLGLALILGVIDDVGHVGPLPRLAAEVAVGLTAALMIPVRLPGPLGVAAVTLVVVLLINGVNMIDGLDALAAGVSLMSAFGFAFVLTGDGRAMAVALVGGLMGFLAFNRPPAKIYLGDGGAYLVGTALALLLALAWSDGRPMAVSIGSLPLVACPAAELGLSVLRRIRSHNHLFNGDRSHIYDQLVNQGWSSMRAVSAYIVAQAFLSSIAIGALQLSPALAGAVTGACALALFLLAATAGFLSPTYPGTAT